MTAINNPAWDTLMFRAEAYGRYYQAESPGMDVLISGESGQRIFAHNIGIDVDTIDPDSLEILVDSFESAYTEQDSGRRNFPRCVCPVWTHDLDVFELVARDAQCPAHDGDAWNEHMNAHQH